MFFRTEGEIRLLLERFGEPPTVVETWERPTAVDGSVLVRLPRTTSAGHWASLVVPTWFSPAHGWLLWVRQSGIFPSTELLHLYYTLRSSHGDHGELRSRPGHEFLGYEITDLRSFVFLTVASGWDAHLITFGGPGRAYFSHDGWLRYSIDAQLVPRTIDDLEAIGAEYSLG